MKIPHHFVKNPIFELVKVVEVDIQLSDEIAWTYRIEIFRDTEQFNRYRCRVWELELFRLIPSFPRNENNEPAHLTDDTIMVERGIGGSETASILNKTFEASSLDDALDM